MNKIIEIVAMVLGGLSIFLVCFLGFSRLSGVPLHEIPVVGSLFPAPAEEEESEGETAKSPKRVEHKSDMEVVQSGIGSLGVWDLPSPYTAEELRSLTDELKTRLLVLDRREKELQDREQNLELEHEALAERFTSLEQLRKELEQFEAELDLREEEVRAMEGTRDERNKAKWASVAPVLASLPPEEAATKIIQYSPEDAAEILHAMPDTAASGILTSIPDANFREYLDAYSEKSTASN